MLPRTKANTKISSIKLVYVEGKTQSEVKRDLCHRLAGLIVLLSWEHDPHSDFDFAGCTINQEIKPDSVLKDFYSIGLHH
jgi:hypothetical protein